MASRDRHRRNLHGLLFSRSGIGDALMEHRKTYTGCLRELGRDPSEVEVPVVREVYVAETRKEAEARARRLIGSLYKNIYWPWDLAVPPMNPRASIPRGSSATPRLWCARSKGTKRNWESHISSVSSSTPAWAGGSPKGRRAFRKRGDPPFPGKSLAAGPRAVS